MTKSGERKVIRNRTIVKNQELPKKKEIAEIFERGDIVTTAEGLLAEVVTLFGSGKVGIQFLAPQKATKRTARIPERLSLFARRKTMQFVPLPL